MRLSAVRRLAQGAYHAATAVAGQGLDREPVAATRRLPVTVIAQDAARHEAMQVHMPREVLAPGVHDRGHAELAVEATMRITRKRVHRRPCRLAR